MRKKSQRCAGSATQSLTKIIILLKDKPLSGSAELACPSPLHRRRERKGGEREEGEGELPAREQVVAGSKMHSVASAAPHSQLQGLSPLCQMEIKAKRMHSAASTSLSTKVSHCWQCLSWRCNRLTRWRRESDRRRTHTRRVRNAAGASPSAGCAVTRRRWESLRMGEGLWITQLVPYVGEKKEKA